MIPIELSDEPPAALIAMVELPCFDQIQKSEATAQTVVDYGYPSLLFDLMPDADADALDLMQMAANEGDRGFSMLMTISYCALRRRALIRN